MPTVSTCLFLSPFFFPETISTGRYNTSIAEGLRDAGVRTVVLTSAPLYPQWKPTASRAHLSGIEVIRGGAWMRYPKFRVFRRLVLELWFACFLAYELPRHRNSANAVIAVFPPVLFAPLIKRLLRKGTPMVGIVHDLQSIFARNDRSALGRMAGQPVRRAERMALRACDRLVFLSESMARHAIATHGLDASRCAVHLPFVSVANVGSDNGNLAAAFKGGRRHIVYAGALGEKQNPGQLISCFQAIIRMRPNVICHLFSGGPIFDSLKSRCAGVEGLRFHDLVAEQDLAELFERSSVQVVPQSFGTSEAALPSKLPNLIAAGVPVLAICQQASELGDLVAQAQAGAVVHSWEPPEVARAALRLLDETENDSRSDRRNRACAFVERHFNRQELIDDLMKFLDQDTVESQAR